MAFGLYRIILEDKNQNKKEVYEYGEHDIDAIEQAIIRHGFPAYRVKAKKLANAIDLLDAAGHYQ